MIERVGSQASECRTERSDSLNPLGLRSGRSESSASQPRASRVIPPNPTRPARSHYWSGPCERLFPNFSNMLNPMEASICCSDSWLQSYKQERSKFRQQKISRKLSSPPIDISPAVVRTL